MKERTKKAGNGVHNGVRQGTRLEGGAWAEGQPGQGHRLCMYCYLELITTTTTVAATVTTYITTIVLPL